MLIPEMAVKNNDGFLSQGMLNTRNLNTLHWHLAANLFPKINEYILNIIDIDKLYDEQFKRLDTQLDALAGTGFLKEERITKEEIAIHYINMMESQFGDRVVHRSSFQFDPPRKLYDSHIILIPEKYYNPEAFLKYAITNDDREITIHQVYEDNKHWINQIVDLDAQISAKEKFELFLFNTIGKS